MALIPNRPTPEGRAIGEHLARWADAADSEQRKQFPKMAERCVTCAFRKGTIPNGCPETVMDALKCVIEGVDFMCHHSPKDDREPCMGWLLLVSQSKGYGKAPWDFAMQDWSAEERAEYERKRQSSKPSEGMK